ncbi:molybdopterin synthase sulfur carrier subunit [Pseudomonas protegens]|jgi:molybdopterin synthase sulfur carrier subunit|uniref:Molybdopterin synthase sulfur carrier subunit n=4 Tax=Pseudomonas TaxID=286 RepID=A0ABY2VKF8_9PSED|nr:MULTISPECIES: MoaD/ThiS family protein [Pseudomonas]BCQ59552.1 molybdopterin synthase sulfur carrier subunit [Pseudomonas sp. Boi14]GED75789.1 molybdopterin synthase sulfur carrier subunit [Pseudomonas fluorescens]AAY90326.1 putative molybdopterin converting factor, subunit 1 [Pseudomonas protegens Pf-5]AGL82851.1 molybdenum cofactor biosynthesis protein D [Pseudomonas protegens CHA0]APC20288.1 molybdopterin synthase sulfur carrier subunit [Pseudomonas protegens]
MKISVKFFARYREALGIDGLEIEGVFQQVEDVRQALLSRDGAEVLAEQNLMCARNEELCQLDEPLEDGDEVAFFPTVTGG